MYNRCRHFRNRFCSWFNFLDCLVLVFFGRGLVLSGPRRLLMTCLNYQRNHGHRVVELD